jgi:heme/copper-type cytochrome/quinol oxidase subunit 2
MLESLHDLIIVWLVVILMVVIIVGWFSLTNGASIFLKKESTLLEVTWTIVPILILSLIAFPSLFLLNKIETLLPFNTLKIIRNQ